MSGTSALEVVTIRPAPRGPRGRGPQVGVGADVDDADPVRAYAEVLDDLVAGGAGDGEDGVQLAGDPLLHPGEGVPAAYGGPAAAVGRGLQVEPAVHGDGVVDRRHERGPEVAEEPVSEGLVVVDDVELAAPGQQMAAGAQAEGERLGESAGPHGGDLGQVDPVAVLAALRGAEGVGLAVEVEAGQLGERNALVEHRVGLRADHLDAVAEAGQLPAEVADVHALAAAERIALVREECDTQRPVAGPGGGAVARAGACLYGLSGHTRPPSDCVFAGA